MTFLEILPGYVWVLRVGLGVYFILCVVYIFAWALMLVFGSQWLMLHVFLFGLPPYFLRQSSHGIWNHGSTFKARLPS